jgi:hypothetical protein
LDAGLHALHPFFRLRGDGKCRATRPARRSSLFRLRGTIGCRAPRPAPGNFPLVRKVAKGTAGVPPLHSLRSASAVTLFPAELRIVHSRKVPASVSAPQGADPLSFRAKRGISHSGAYSIVDGDSSALARLRMTGVSEFTGMHRQITHANARSAKSTQPQCVYERHVRQ